MTGLIGSGISLGNQSAGLPSSLPLWSSPVAWGIFINTQCLMTPPIYIYFYYQLEKLRTHLNLLCLPCQTKCTALLKFSENTCNSSIYLCCNHSLKIMMCDILTRFNCDIFRLFSLSGWACLFSFLTFLFPCYFFYWSGAHMQSTPHFPLLLYFVIFKYGCHFITTSKTIIHWLSPLPVP